MVIKILTVIGARPQFIKAAPLSKALRVKHTEILVHTGQHYDVNMSEVFFKEMDIPLPNYNLEVGSASHGVQTALIIMRIEEIIQIEKPDAVIVYGDTNSTLAAAIATSKLNIPIIHVESGLRSYNKEMPEEQNRIVTDHLSSILFCPTSTAVANLEKEGITKGVHNVGDIMLDSLLMFREKSLELFEGRNYTEIIQSSNHNLDDVLANGYYLSTIHRANNTNEIKTLETILDAFSELDKPVLMPLHPRTRHLLGMSQTSYANVIIIPPVGYLEMIYLITKSKMVITDSGGLQKEAFFLKKHCTTLRNETEWLETLKNNWNVLAKIEKNDIKLKSMRTVSEDESVNSLAFGHGNTANLIVDIIEREI